MYIDTLQYCEKCQHWCGKRETCDECGTITVAKKVPKRRADYYFIDGVEEPLVSVTTIINIINKPFLVGWAAREAAKAALRNPLLSIQEAASSCYKIRDKAGNVGSDVHRIIDFSSRGGTYDKTKMTERVRKYIEAYENCQATLQPEVLFAEQEVYSRTHLYAGQLDRIAKLKDGLIWLLDFKTSKTLSNETALQLVAYKVAVEEIGLTKIDKMGAIHLRADGTYAFHEFQGDFEVFLACKKVWQWAKMGG